MHHLCRSKDNFSALNRMELNQMFVSVKCTQKCRWTHWSGLNGHLRCPDRICLHQWTWTRVCVNRLQHHQTSSAHSAAKNQDPLVPLGSALLASYSWIRLIILYLKWRDLCSGLADLLSLNVILCSSSAVSHQDKRAFCDIPGELEQR